MVSIVFNQFPMMVWKEDSRLLWNPIYKKALKNRPEERVRLRIIEYLLETGWSRHRISTEEAIDVDFKDTILRTDVICYSREFEPVILIECKAEQVALTRKAAEQSAQYNRKVNAPFVLLTNGVRDLWFDISEGSVVRLEQPPDSLGHAPDRRKRDFSYWNKRGFTGNNADPRLRLWLENMLSTCFAEPKENISYLEFKNSPLEFDLSHYYRIFPVKGHKIALSFLSTPYGGTRLTAVLNQKGENTGVIDINLDMAAKKEIPNATAFSFSGTYNFDATKDLALNFGSKESDDFEQLPRQLVSLFEDLT